MFLPFEPDPDPVLRASSRVRGCICQCSRVVSPFLARQVLEENIGYLVGDCLIAAAFLSYAGPFLSNYRDELVEKTWLAQVLSCHTRTPPTLHHPTSSHPYSAPSPPNLAGPCTVAPHMDPANPPPPHPTPPTPIPHIRCQHLIVSIADGHGRQDLTLFVTAL